MLYRFYRRSADTDLHELQSLVTTVEASWSEILAFPHAGITNAGSEEGTNRVTKTIAATCMALTTPPSRA